MNTHRSAPIPSPLRCAGSALAMGRSQGQAAPHGPGQGSPAAELWWAVAPAVVGKGLAGPRFAGLLARRVGGRCWARTNRDLNRFVPRQWRRQQGLALGQGLTLVEAAVQPMLECIVGSPAAPASSVVAVSRGQSTPFVVLRLDGPAGRDTPLFVRHNRPDTRLADLDLADAPGAGTLAGVNEAGLIITCNHRFFSSPGAAIVPPSLLCKELLETAETVDEALAMLNRWPPTQSSLLTLLDRGGRLATADITDRIMVRRHADLVVTTNHGLGRPARWPAWRRLLPGKLGHNEIPSSVMRQGALLRSTPTRVVRALEAVARLGDAGRRTHRWGLDLRPVCTATLMADPPRIEVHGQSWAQSPGVVSPGEKPRPVPVVSWTIDNKE